MEWYFYILIIVTGAVTGFINTIAGSGSLISLPVLMFLGLPADVANGTNRIGILFQSLTAVRKFKKEKQIDIKTETKLIIPAIIGSCAGTLSATNLNEEIMRMTIGGLLVVMFFIILLKPQKWINGNESQASKSSLLNYIVFTAIGFYGGFIQAGVGFFLLSGLVLSAGYNLVKANAVKVLITFIFTPFSLAIFIFYNQVHFLSGLLLALGGIFGAHIAASISIKKGASFIRYILLIMIFVSALKLLNIEKLF